MIAVKYLEWDSEFFGLRIGQVEGHELDAASIVELQSVVKETRLDCVYFLANAGSCETISLGEQAGFGLKDIRVSLELPVLLPRPLLSDPDVRLATAADAAKLETIAAVAHRNTRFFSDARFATERCQELYRVWIRKSCDGWADAVFVGHHDGEPVGYISCHLRSGELGDIGLVGVSERARGRSWGTRLLDSALGWFATHGCNRVQVVSQGKNIRAQRLYQRAGFLTSSVQLWYHLWPSLR